jgi:hypothetical protein
MEMQCSFLCPQNLVFMQYSASVECDERLIVRHIHISREKLLSVSSCLSVRLSASISAVLTGRIFLNFLYREFLKKSVEKIHIQLQSDKISGTLP